MLSRTFRKGASVIAIAASMSGCVAQRNPLVITEPDVIAQAGIVDPASRDRGTLPQIVAQAIATAPELRQAIAEYEQDKALFSRATKMNDPEISFFSFRAVLDDSGKADAATQEAAMKIAARKASIDEAKNIIAIQATEHYFNACLNKALLTKADLHGAQLDHLHKKAISRAGKVGSPMIVRMANSQRDAAWKLKKKARENLGLAEGGLRSITHDSNIQVICPPPQIRSLLPRSKEEATAIGLNNHASVLQRSARIQAADRTVEVDLRSAKGQAMLNISQGLIGSLVLNGLPALTGAGIAPLILSAFTVDYSAFSGGKAQAQVNASEAGVAVAVSQYDKAHDEVVKKIDAAYVKLDGYDEQRERDRSQLQNDKEILKSVEEEFYANTTDATLKSWTEHINTHWALQKQIVEDEYVVQLTQYTLLGNMGVLPDALNVNDPHRSNSTDSKQILLTGKVPDASAQSAQILPALPVVNGPDGITLQPYAMAGEQKAYLRPVGNDYVVAERVGSQAPSMASPYRQSGQSGQSGQALAPVVSTGPSPAVPPPQSESYATMPGNPFAKGNQQGYSSSSPYVSTSPYGASSAAQAPQQGLAPSPYTSTYQGGTERRNERAGYGQPNQGGQGGQGNQGSNPYSSSANAGNYGSGAQPASNYSSYGAGAQPASNYSTWGR